MYCKYLTKRSYKNKPYIYCRYKKCEIILPTCKNCSKFEYKAYKPIKKVSKKRIFVTDDTYKKVYSRDKGICKLCGSNYQTNLHHIIPRSEDKNLINDINNCILLCNRCHLEIVHRNMKKYKPILQEIIKNSAKTN